jgi:hypothetical protein
MLFDSFLFSSTNQYICTKNETMKSQNKSNPKKCLVVRVPPESLLGQAVIYVQNSQFNNQAALEETFAARFLPFAIDKNRPDFQAIAIQCANQCESWARAIREYAGLTGDRLVNNSTNNPTRSLADSTVRAIAIQKKEVDKQSNNDDFPQIKPQNPVDAGAEVKISDLEQFELELEEIITNADSSKLALDALIDIQPDDEEDWTEEQ